MELLATVLYVVPLMAFVAARLSRSRSLAEVAVDVPAAVAADLLFVLVLSRFVPLEVAALASRPIAVVAAGAWALRRRARGDAPAWPAALRPRPVVLAVLTALVTTAISAHFSRKYHIWDRYWHISLVPTIRGQTLPFANVYDPSRPISYHFAGDALAAMFQAFSRTTLHSSHALSLVHDVMFALTGLTLGLLLAHAAGASPGRASSGARGVLRGAAVVLLAVACVVAGPTAMLRPDGQTWTGYDFVNYVTLSFRPHACVAGLLTFGFAGAVLEIASRDLPARRGRAFAFTLVLVTAGLAITDEASTGMLGLALGLAWLVRPAVLGPTRKVGLATLLGLLAAVVAANVACAGLLAPGAERPGMTLVAWRAPGFGNPTIPFSAPHGLAFFASDLAAFALFAVAAAWAALRGRAPRVAGVGVMLLGLVVLGVFALGRLHVPPKAVEAHRFVTAAMLVGPLVASVWLLRRPRAPSKVAWSVVGSLLLLGVVLPAASTASWIRDPKKTPFPSLGSFRTRDDLFTIDCAAEVGAHRGERPAPAYLSSSVLFVYAGCRPTFIAGKSGGHKIKTSQPLFGLDALADEHAMVDAAAPLPAVCPAGGGGDAVCLRAMKGAPCEPVAKTRLGEEIVRCTLTPEDRVALLATRPKPKPKAKPKAKPRPKTSAPPEKPPPPPTDDDEPDMP